MEKIKLLMAQQSPTPETLLRAFNDLFSRQCLNSAGLAVGTTTTKFKIGNTVFAMVNGVPVQVATADGPVLTGYNLTSGQLGGFVVTVDGTGTIYAIGMNPGATIGAVSMPPVPPSQVAVGLVLINTANAATFTGGTTLMSATNVAYVNIVGPFVPTNAF